MRRSLPTRHHERNSGPISVNHSSLSQRSPLYGIGPSERAPEAIPHVYDAQRCRQEATDRVNLEQWRDGKRRALDNRFSGTVRYSLPPREQVDDIGLRSAYASGVARVLARTILASCPATNGIRCP